MNAKLGQVQQGRTLHGKLWDMHRIATLEDGSELLHIDRIVLHERAGALVHAPALEEPAAPCTIQPWCSAPWTTCSTRVPGRTEATTLVPNGQQFIEVFRGEAASAGFSLFDLGDERQGIAHVSMPEQGVALPGLSLVCADSHTGTIGGIGALAWGIGISETEHALATQTIALKRPNTMRVTIDGQLGDVVSAKDVILYLIGQVGAAGAVGYMVEYAGSAVREMSVEGRMTLCNMAVEFGAWSAVVAPDETTVRWLEGRPFVPKGVHVGSARSKVGVSCSPMTTRPLTARSVSTSRIWCRRSAGGQARSMLPAVSGCVPDLDAIDDPVARGSAEAGVALHGSAARPGAVGRADQRRLHRFLHQRPP